MDLITVKTKLNSGKYNTVQNVMDDLNLIWSNCKLFNREESVKKIYNANYIQSIYRLAIKCQKICKKLYSKYFKKNSVEEDSNNKKISEFMVDNKNNVYINLNNNTFNIYPYFSLHR